MSTPPSTCESNGILWNLRRVLAVGWGQVSEPQIKNVDRFYSMCPEEVADFLGGRLLNFGYWEDGAIAPQDAAPQDAAPQDAAPQDAAQQDAAQQDAARSLVHQVAELASIREGDKVLDVGCGFGVAAMMLHREYQASQVIGVNVTQCHLDYAQRAAKDEGVDHAVTFQYGDATNLPFDNDCFDHIIALESAFHFSPREDFFREAARVLKPDGVLTIADVIPLKPNEGWLIKFIAAKLWLFPFANNYGPQSYLRRIADAGFSDVESRSIGETVYPGYVQWTLDMAQKKQLAKRLGWIKAAIYRWQTQLLGLLKRRGQLDYLLIRAVKTSKPFTQSKEGDDRA